MGRLHPRSADGRDLRGQGARRPGPDRQPRRRLQQGAVRRRRSSTIRPTMDLGRLPGRGQGAHRPGDQAVRLLLPDGRLRGLGVALRPAALAERRLDPQRGRHPSGVQLARGRRGARGPHRDGRRDESVFLDMQNSHYTGLFNNGKIGMLVTGPWDLSSFPDVDYGVEILPGSDGDHQTIAGPDMWAVFDNGDGRAQAAEEFLAWLTAPEQVKADALATGHLPIRLSVVEDPDFVERASTPRFPGVGVFAENLTNVSRPGRCSRPTRRSRRRWVSRSCRRCWREGRPDGPRRGRGAGERRPGAGGAVGSGRAGTQEGTEQPVPAVPGVRSRRRLGVHPARPSSSSPCSGSSRSSGGSSCRSRRRPDLAGARMGRVRELRAHRRATTRREQAAINTIYYTMLFVPISILLSLFVAYALNRKIRVHPFLPAGGVHPGGHLDDRHRDHVPVAVRQELRARQLAARASSGWARSGSSRTRTRR